MQKHTLLPLHRKTILKLGLCVSDGVAENLKYFSSDLVFTENLKPGPICNVLTTPFLYCLQVYL